MTPDELENHVRERLDRDRLDRMARKDETEELEGYYEKTLAGEKFTNSELARMELLLKDLRLELRTEATH